MAGGGQISDSRVTRATDGRSDRNRLLWARLLWTGFILTAGVVIVFDTGRSPVNTSYRAGAERWLQGEDLYDGGGTGFIYLPQSAILHVPFALLPRPAREIAWRLVTIGLFAAGVFHLSRAALAMTRGRMRTGEGQAGPALADSLAGSFCLLVTLLVLPKTWTVALNGQATPAMAGLMLLAVVDQSEGRWGRAAACLMLALAFKPLAIVLLLLAAALYAPLRPRLALAGGLFLAAPYLVGSPQYVTAQYAGFLDSLGDSARLGLTSEWPQLFALLQWAGWQISPPWQTALRLLAAVLTLLAACRAVRKFEPHEQAVLIYSLAGCYLLLFNPRTENNGYTLLMPGVAAFAARAILIERNRVHSAILVTLLILMTAGHEISRALTPAAPFVWPCPLACLGFLVFLTVQICRADVSSRAVPIEGSVDRSHRAAA